MLTHNLPCAPYSSWFTWHTTSHRIMMSGKRDKWCQMNILAPNFVASYCVSKLFCIVHVTNRKREIILCSQAADRKKGVVLSDSSWKLRIIAVKSKNVNQITCVMTRVMSPLQKQDSKCAWCQPSAKGKGIIFGTFLCCI